MMTAKENAQETSIQGSPPVLAYNQDVISEALISLGLGYFHSKIKCNQASVPGQPLLQAGRSVALRCPKEQQQLLEHLQKNTALMDPRHVHPRGGQQLVGILALTPAQSPAWETSCDHSCTHLPQHPWDAHTWQHTFEGSETRAASLKTTAGAGILHWLPSQAAGR